VVKESMFEVKEKPTPLHKREKFTDQELAQRVIEFTDFAETPKQVIEKGLFDDDEFTVTSVSPKPNKTKEAAVKPNTRQNATPLMVKANIDQLEKVPAYKRKNIKIDEAEHSKVSNVSRFTLSEEEGDIFLRSDNAYLHDNVD
jgi:cell division protein FtsZ